MEINEEQSDVNASEKRRDRKRTKLTPCSGGRLYRLGALTLGLMCILQATLNVSLRIILYNNLMEEREQLHASKNMVTEERDQLKMENGRLNERIRILKEERTCPQQWKTFGSSCYYTSGRDRKIWEDSKQDCLIRGADLVVINSREEQLFINELYGPGLFVWIGLSDRDTNGRWTWVDGTPLTTEYWHSGQPNGTRGDGDCVAFIHLGSGKLGGWDKKGCSTGFRWICEK